MSRYRNIQTKLDFDKNNENCSQWRGTIFQVWIVKNFDVKGIFLSEENNILTLKGTNRWWDNDKKENLSQ